MNNISSSNSFHFWGFRVVFRSYFIRRTDGIFGYHQPKMAAVDESFTLVTESSGNSRSYNGLVTWPMLRHMIGFLVLNDLNDEQLTLRVRTENNELGCKFERKKQLKILRVNKIIDDKSYFFYSKAWFFFESYKIQMKSYVLRFKSHTVWKGKFCLKTIYFLYIYIYT